MAFFLVKGRNGVVIKDDDQKAEYCKKYLKESVVEIFAYYDDAMLAGVKHLESITPKRIPVPHSFRLNDMITVKMLTMYYYYNPYSERNRHSHN